MSIDAAIARSARFLRDHHHDPSKYYVAGAHWGSWSEKAEEDVWSIDWVSREKGTKPPEFLIVIYDNTRVFFGGRA